MSSAQLGTLSILLAFLAAMVGVLVAVAYGRRRAGALINAGRWSLGLTAGLFTIALIVLTVAMLGDEFGIEYVRKYSDRALPTAYKIAAVWAGREGSFLLWAWMLAAMSWLTAWTIRKEPSVQQAAVCGILSAVCAAFAGLMLFGSDPFAASPALPAGMTMAEVDGAGLNPLLWHPAMIAHPPFLFAGYAAFTIPFALMMGALIARREDNDWVFRVRRWTLRAWSLLTVGIFLGSWWAYVVLGWGGYWGWDPVENSSLLPWLPATAVLHSMIMQQRRGMLRVSNMLLVAVTFLLCLTAAFITRGGLIDSPHAFAASGTGWFFLGVIAAGIVFVAAVAAWRWRLLRQSPPLTRLVSTEGGFIAGNALLTIIAATILAGIFWPLISPVLANVPIVGALLFRDPGTVTTQPVTLNKNFYNAIVVPMALCLTALMALGPLLSSVTAAGFPKRRLILGAVGAILGLVMSLFVMLPDVAWHTIEANWLVVAAAVIVGFAAFTIFDDIVRTLLRPLFQGNGAAGVWRAFRANSRRFSAMLAHAGMAMIVIGVAGSSLADKGTDLLLKSGQSEKAGRYTVCLDSFREVPHTGYASVEASTSVSTAGGKKFSMKPERRFYDKYQKQPSSVVALRSGLGENLYMMLTGYSSDGSIAAIKVLVHPLVTWIWIGSILMALAASLCALHRPTKRDEKEQPDAGLKATATAKPDKKSKSQAMAAEVRS